MPARSIQSSADDPTSGATVVVRWRNATPAELDPDNSAYNPLVAKPTRYQIALWFPSSGTANGRNVREAVVKVRYPVGASDYKEIILIVNQTTGGRWVRLGSAGSTAYTLQFQYRASGSVPCFAATCCSPLMVVARWRSMPTIPPPTPTRTATLMTAGRLVVFDGVRFMPDVGAFYSSPVAATHAGGARALRAAGIHRAHRAGSF
jgi:hypothetical protein